MGLLSENTLSQDFVGEEESSLNQHNMGVLRKVQPQRAVSTQARKVASAPVLDHSGGRSRLDLTHLRKLREEKPDRQIALLRRAWPDIMAALSSGHTLKHVCESLNEDGIAVAYPTLRTTVARLRREQGYR